MIFYPKFLGPFFMPSINNLFHPNMTFSQLQIHYSCLEGEYLDLVVNIYNIPSIHYIQICFNFTASNNFV